MVVRHAVRRVAAGVCTVLVGTAIAWPASAAGAAPSGELRLSATSVSLIGRTADVKAAVGGDLAAHTDGPAVRGDTQPQRTAGSVTADEVSFTVECSPDSVVIGGAEASCTIRAVNSTFDDQVVDIDSRANRKIIGTGVDGATAVGARNSYLHDAALPGRPEGVPSVDPGVTFGYLPLDAFGISPVPIGDEEFLAFTVPPYLYNGRTYTVISVNSNGYLVAGTATAEDNNCCNLPTGPSAARPNSLLAPFWTDLDGTGAPGVFVGTLTDGVSDWLVVEHRVNVFGTLDQRVFQVWIGLNGVQDISFTYDPDNLPALPSQDVLIGAENSDGLGEVAGFAPTEDLVVTSTDAGPAGEVSYTTTVKGKRVGLGIVRSRLTIEGQPGWTQVRETVDVTAP